MAKNKHNLHFFWIALDVINSRKEFPSLFCPVDKALYFASTISYEHNWQLLIVWTMRSQSRQALMKRIGETIDWTKHCLGNVVCLFVECPGNVVPWKRSETKLKRYYGTGGWRATTLCTIALDPLAYLSMDKQGGSRHSRTSSFFHLDFGRNRGVPRTRG